MATLRESVESLDETSATLVNDGADLRDALDGFTVEESPGED